MTRILLLCALCCAPVTALGDPAEIVAVDLTQSGTTWRADVTLRHGDTGWDDYADGWRVEAPDGTVLGTRTLYHPHVEEQPFTRSLSGITVPETLQEVRVRARTNTDGWSDATVTVPLP